MWGKKGRRTRQGDHHLLFQPKRSFARPFRQPPTYVHGRGLLDPPLHDPVLLLPEPERGGVAAGERDGRGVRVEGHAGAVGREGGGQGLLG